MGAALVAAWAGGTGVAQANGGPGTVPSCETSSASSSSASPSYDLCSVDIYVAATGDCADPETLSVYIDTKGLMPSTAYELAVGSDDFTMPAGTDEPAFVFDFTTNANGNATKIFDGEESADVQFPNGAFTLQFAVFEATEDDALAYGEFTVDNCPVTESASPTTSTPAPTTSTASTTTSAAAAAATTTAAPVAVTPAAAHAAPVLANTGAPVAGVALVGCPAGRRCRRSRRHPSPRLLIDATGWLRPSSEHGRRPVPSPARARLARSGGRSLPVSEPPPGPSVGPTPSNLDGVMALDRPPRWGLIAIVVLLLTNVGLVLLLVQQQGSSAGETSAPAAATSSSARSSSAPASSTDASTSSPTASGETTADRGTLAVYGDGYSSGNSEGGTGAAGWPALVSQQLGMPLQLTAATLAGYVRPGSTDQTYPQLVAAQPPNGAAVTVVFGSRNDVSAAPGDVQAAATATFDAIRSADASTTLVVIGPCWSSADVPAELGAVSAAVQAAAQQAGATYVDPVQQGWFADPNGLVSPADGISLLDAGHVYLAGMITSLIVSALEGSIGGR